MNLRRLEGLRTIVTGAGSGIGRTIAVRFALEGARVACADLNLEAATQTVNLLETSGLAFKVDVSNPEHVQTLVKCVLEQWGGLECLVNNAGIGVAAKITDTREEDWDRVMNSYSS